jgi:hypothetical protein
MESYQSIGIVIGIIGIVLGLVGSLAYGWLAWVAVVSIVGIIVVLVNTKHHQGVGITLIVLGILGNLLLLIPGIMAYRFKPKSELEIKSQSKGEGEYLEHTDPERREQKYQEELKEVRAKLEADEKRLSELERKKEEIGDKK